MKTQPKLIDFDGLFDEKLAQYMEENAGKHTEKQWEEIIPKLYRKFGDTFIKSVQNTPKGYYAAMTDEELTQSLVRHIEEEVPVSDFLCRELEARGCTEELIALLDTENGQLLTTAINLAGGNPKAYPAYFRLLERETNDEIRETVIEQLKSNADPAKESALLFYERGIAQEEMLEVLSRCKQRDERIYELLEREFRQSENLPMHASYLAAYGDPRALPVLLAAIDREEINYLEYQELKYAIEALGGEYTKPRDFSEDVYFKEISEQSQILPDFTGNEKTEA